MIDSAMTQPKHAELNRAVPFAFYPNTALDGKL